MKFFTFRKAALAVKAPWQALKFLAGKGYYLVGNPPPPIQPEPKNQPPFTRPVSSVTPVGHILTMYDDTQVSLIPPDAQAVAGYVDGKYATWQKITVAFPHARKLSIAVFAKDNAECLDVELGDATNAEAAAWYKRQIARGVVRPKIYTSLANVEPLRKVMASQGVHLAYDDIWSAHYTMKEHRCGPQCGYGLNGTVGATQYNDRAMGRSLDASLVSSTFFDGPAV